MLESRHTNRRLFRIKTKTQMLKKVLINCFLVAWLLIMIIDPTPQVGQLHGKLKEAIDPYLDATGLWQGNWRLFAPSPDKTNASVTAEVAFEDGKVVLLRTPKWREISAWERLVRFRQAEFIDSIRLDSNRFIWPNYAEYLRRTVKHPTDENLRVKEVLLSRRWVDFAPPTEAKLKEFPETPMMTGSYIMCVEQFKLED